MHEKVSASVISRIAPLDRARTLVTLLVLIHHSVVNYTYFGRGDHARWLGFDLVVLFNDSFFMAFMFLVSGLFVASEWSRKGTGAYLRDRTWRLGVPFLISIFVLMPIAYYPTFLRYHLPGTTDFNFFHFWLRTITVGPWPSGPAWFLWVLLALDVLAAGLLAVASNTMRTWGEWLAARSNRPVALFAGFLALTLCAYVPMRMWAGDASWLEFGPLPVQTSRILLYASSFFVGLIIGTTDLRAGILYARGSLVLRWPLWIVSAAIGYAAILLVVYARHNWLPDINNPPPIWSFAYGVALSLFSASMAFVIFAIMLRWADRGWPLFDRIQPYAYGIFLTHYIFIIWIQYALYGLTLPAAVKAAIVFAGTLALSWLSTYALKRLPLGRMI